MYFCMQAEIGDDEADELPGTSGRHKSMPREQVVTVGGRTRRRALSSVDVDVGVGVSGKFQSHVLL